MRGEGGSRCKNLCMMGVLGFLIRYFSNYYSLHRSDLAARAAPLEPRLRGALFVIPETTGVMLKTCSLIGKHINQALFSPALEVLG